jgi:hypothetical protein
MVIMQRTVTVKESDNCLSVSVAGERSYVKITEAESGQVLFHSAGSGVTDVQQVVKPGKYRVETDGTITESRSMHIDLGTDLN